MKQSHNYLMPDYFERFSCKMGECRSACCVGWPVTFSREDYFKLIGVECSPDLRRKLDCAMHLTEYPTPEEFAQITPRYDGNCPLRLGDGRCGLHAELGDSALAYICRLYPRGVRLQSGFECSCANSCEGVLELLFQQDEPIKFLSKELTFDVPSPAETDAPAEAAIQQKIRLDMIHLLQDRSKRLPQRLMAVGRAMQDTFADFTLDGDRTSSLGNANPESGLKAALELLYIMTQNSNSIQHFGEAALSWFGDDAETTARYHAAKQHLEQRFSKWEIWFEHMLVNHVFFVRFPFQEERVSPKDQFLSLCAVYGSLRALLLGWMAQRESIDDFVDAAAAIFRHVDHTAFDRNAGFLLRKLGRDDWNSICELIAI